MVTSAGDIRSSIQYRICSLKGAARDTRDSGSCERMQSQSSDEKCVGGVVVVVNVGGWVGKKRSVQLSADSS